MAAIGTIRKQSGLLIFIIGVALAAFVLGDLFRPSGQGKNEPIGVVNGEEISFVDFNKLAEQNIENQRTQSQSGVMSSSQKFYLKKQTFELMVQDILLNKNYDKLGLQVSKDELFDLVQGKYTHPVIMQYFSDPQTGQFNPNFVREFISALPHMDNERRNQWFALEKYIKDDRQMEKFKNLIMKSFYIPTLLASQDYESKGKEASLDYFGVKYQTISDDEITIEESDFTKFYNKNKYRFETDKDQRSIDYVVFQVTPSESDIRTVERNISDLYQEMKEIKAREIPFFVNSVSDVPFDSTWKKRGELPVRIEAALFDAEQGQDLSPYLEYNTFSMARLMESAMRPDSMKASHILISFKGAARADTAVKRTKDQAKVIADSLLAVLKKSPKKFEDMAKEFSDGPTGPSGGDLGWFTDGTMVPQFNEAVINTKKGGITIAETVFGYHVINVTDKKEPVKKVRVAMIKREVTPSSATYQDIYQKASSFSGESRTAEQFNASVADNAFAKRSSGFFHADESNMVNVLDPRPIVRWAFDKKTKVGDVSDVFEDEDRFIVALVSAKRDKGYLSVDDVRAQIEPLVKREKKAELIMKKLSDANGDFQAKAAKMGAEIMHYDDLSYSAANIKNFGPEAEVIGKIFTYAEGETSAPIEGNMAIYVVRIGKIQLPTPLDSYKGTQAALETSFKMNERRILSSIRDGAEVVDNTLLYY